jgi:hypothetical protein
LANQKDQTQENRPLAAKIMVVIAIQDSTMNQDQVLETENQDLNFHLAQEVEMNLALAIIRALQAAPHATIILVIASAVLIQKESQTNFLRLKVLVVEKNLLEWEFLVLAAKDRKMKVLELAKEIAANQLETLEQIQNF